MYSGEEGEVLESNFRKKLNEMIVLKNYVNNKINFRLLLLLSSFLHEVDWYCSVGFKWFMIY